MGALLAAGCAHGGTGATARAGGASADATAADAATAERLYRDGVEAMEAGVYPDATTAFEAIRSRHPYARHAALAELRLGDVEMRQGKHIEAVELYRAFLKYHPGHLDADYAQYMVGEAYFAQLPHDWWFMPPSAEKDPGNLGLAIAAYEALLARRDDGPMASQARAHLAECRRRLADHEIYVARFYLDQRQYAAAVTRAEGVLARFAGLGADAEALLIAGRAHVALGDGARASQALEALAERFPDSPQAARGQRLLRSLTPAG